MELNAQEKKLIRYLLDNHLVEVKKNEVLADTRIGLLAAEVKYEVFVRNLIKKMK